jgi:hypothetical protein
MVKNLLIVFSLLYMNQMISQKLSYNALLSKDFIFEIKLERISSRWTAPEILDSCLVDIKIINKNNQKEWRSFSRPSEINTACFTNPDNARSYTTGVNLDKPIINNDYGDLIVADFNFDGLEDIAIKRYSSSKGIPKYRFYLQTKDQKFEADNFLTYQMSFFPVIDIASKTLTVNVCEYIMKYRFGEKSQKWVTITD